MKKFVATIIVGVCAYCLLFSVFGVPSATGSMADQSVNDGKSEKTKIAVIDMAFVFKKSKLFEQSKEALKLKIADANDVAKKMVTEIQQLTQKSMSLDKDSEERKELEIRLKRKTKEFEEIKKEGSRTFLKEESEIYLKVYRIAEKEVASYAQAHKIDLVIRFQRDDIDESNPQTMLQNLSRQVVYQNSLDISDEIISAMAEQE